MGGGGYWGDPAAVEVEEGIIGLGRGDSVAEGTRPGVPGDLSVKEAVSEGGGGERFPKDSISEGPILAEGKNLTKDHSTVRYKAGAAPVNSTKQEANLNLEMAANKIDFAQSNAAKCDVSDGSWVFDESYPLYASNECPFIDEGFSCEANGRMDKGYMKLRWQPKHCSIPRWCCITVFFSLLWLLRNLGTTRSLSFTNLM